MGFDRRFILLVKGLVEEGFSKVHLNGLFTLEIPLLRGVHQGCSVAPFLFVLSTQPLMALLEKGAQKGELIGLQIWPGKQLLHQLFADDTGIFINSTEANYRKATSLISVYERISGAQLNLQKLVLIQLNMGPSPDWFARAGCRIAARGEVFKYLGCTVGFDFRPSKILRFLMDNVCKKFQHWSNRLLSMVGRLVIIRHVIRSISIYYLMLFELSGDGYQQLESLCQEFFWGLGEQGNPKIPLVAWDHVGREKIGGRLDLVDFQSLSRSMKYRSILKLLLDYDTEWVSRARELIHKGITKGRWSKEMKGWTTQHFLLLSPKAHVPLRTLRRVLAGWTTPASVLSLRQGVLLDGLSIIQLYYLKHRGQHIDASDLWDLSIWTGSRGIKCIKDLRIDDNWGTIEQLSGNRRSYHFVGQNVVEDLLDFVSKFEGSEPISLEQCSGWQWGDLDLNFTNFRLSTKPRVYNNIQYMSEL